jgi:hypothetical protein
MEYSWGALRDHEEQLKTKLGEDYENKMTKDQ